MRKPMESLTKVQLRKRCVNRHNNFRHTQNLRKDNHQKLACFDHMISNLISLRSGTYDIPDNVCKLQGKELQTMKYKVQTVLGIFKEHYQHSIIDLIYGSWQESRHSSTNMFFTNTLMTNALEKHCEGCTMTSLTRDITHSKHILGFVDDKTQYTKDWKHNDIVKITKNIQYAVQF